MKRAAACVIFAVALLSIAQAQSARESVTFPSLDTNFKGQLTATLYRPAGPGPFPAMVLLHTCGGPQKHEQDWGGWFAVNGYEALVVDSFGPRGVRNVCTGGPPNMRTRAFDAYGGLAFLRTRSEVDGARVGVIGWSHGAGTALVSDDKRFVDTVMQGASFRAAVALYPVCAMMSSVGVAAPLLVLLGSADDWTPAEPCERDAAALAQRGYPVTAYTYPNATHAFDNPADRGTVHVGTNIYTMNFDPDATKDAHDRVKAFLAQNLK
ncbi:MAG TPA: dienelactone hydrolase family protein [Candidatus Binatia bacterium]|nr:dienelactone hydrolase family protein [Candidatus Binatia bacterium]